MGASGYKNITVTDWDTLQLSWSEKSQSVANNETTISWALNLISTNYGAIYSTPARAWYVNIDGSEYSGTVSVAIGNNETKTLASGSTVVKHNPDGSKNFSYSFSQDFQITFSNVWRGTYSGSGNSDLTKIPRAATITGATDFNDEENPTITYSNPAGAAVERLRACIDFDSAISVADYREIDKSVTSGSYTFPLTDEERKNIRENVTGSNSREIWFHLETTIDGVIYYSSLKSKKVTIINATPTITPAVVDMNSTTSDLTGDINTLIKYHSTAACSFNATVYKEATIKACSITNGSTTENKEVAAFYNVESPTFNFSLTDSRENTVNKEVTTGFVDYVKLTCNQEVNIELEGETAARVKVVISGNCFNGSFGAINNTLDLYIRHTDNEGIMGDWINLKDILVEVYTDGNTYTADFEVSDLIYDKAYTFQTKAVDKLENVETVEYTVRLIPVFDWGENDFNFNVPVSIQGNTLEDYVIETGTEAMGSNGTWYWEKWKSGKAVCYGRRNFGNMAVNTQWGYLHCSNTFSQNLPTNLFIEAPTVVDINIISNADYAGWVEQGFDGGANKNSTGSFRLIAVLAATFSQVHFCFNVIGRWK